MLSYSFLPVLTTVLFADGLKDLWGTIQSDWIGPLFLAVIAVAAVILVFKKEIRGLIILAVVAAIGGVLIFAGSGMFGDDGTLSKTAQNLANKIN